MHHYCPQCGKGPLLVRQADGRCLECRNKKKRPRGTCPVCKRKFSLVKTGRLPVHRPEVIGRTRCLGSNAKPMEETGWVKGG